MTATDFDLETVHSDVEELHHEADLLKERVVWLEMELAEMKAKLDFLLRNESPRKV